MPKSDKIKKEKDKKIKEKKIKSQNERQESDKKRTVPIYAAIGVWAFSALMFPLYRIIDFVIVGIISVAVGIFLYVIIPDKKKKEKAEKETTTTLEDEIKEELELDPLSALEKTVAEGELYLDAIKKMNLEVFAYNPNVSLEIAHLERSVKKIFSYIQKHPEDAPKVRRFTEYYMPTVLKLLRSYVDIQAQGITGDNTSQIVSNIEGTIHTMSMAFEKLMDKLYADDVIDITSDIKVLEHLLEQEGLNKEQLHSKEEI